VSSLALALVGTLAALALLLVAHDAFWGYVYRLRLDSDALLTATAADGWPLAVAHFVPRARRADRLPVVLCHGLSANRLNLMLPGPHSLASFLREQGHEVFVCDLRGSGDSVRPPPKGSLSEINFDRHLFFDAPAILAKALEVSGAPRAFWVGHSMGGLLGLALAETEHASKLAGVVAVGSPTRWSFHRPYLKTLLRSALPLAVGGRIRQRWLVRLVAPYLFYLPLLGDIVLNPKNIDPRVNRRVAFHVLADVSRGILEQFEGWLRRDAWDTLSPAMDLRAGLARVTCPVLLMAGSADVLSPPENMRGTLTDLGCADKTLVVVGKERGDKQDYGHGDLIFGAHAPEEVFPFIARWLGEHQPA
jgi:pimeloyl-ACP methyl ester carboxylesterase